jgi:hypothetical protein
MRTTLVVLLVVILRACGKRNVEGTIARDCSGTYIIIGLLDYRVCNTEITEAFDTGTEVEIDYRTINSCAQQEGVIRCPVTRAFKDYIRIKSLKRISGSIDI